MIVACVMTLIQAENQYNLPGYSKIMAHKLLKNWPF